MTYLYAVTCLSGFISGIICKTFFCEKSIRIENDSQENDELNNNWILSRRYIRYLENRLTNIDNNEIVALGPLNIIETQAEASVSQVAINNIEESNNNSTPNATMIIE